MGFDIISAIYWDFLLIPYYKVYETKDNKIVKVFNQKVVNSMNGSNIALIDKSNKLAWWVTNDYIIHKARIMFVVDINNAVPLKYEITKEISGNIITKERTTTKIKIDKSKMTKETNGIPKKIVEISYPTTLLYQLLEGHFIDKAMSEPPSKWEELKWVLIVGIIAGAFLLWQLMGSGIVGVK